MKRVAGLVLVLMIMISCINISAVSAAEQTAKVLTATHLLAYNIEKQNGSFYPSWPILVEVSKGKSNTVSSLDQIVFSPQCTYKKLDIVMTRLEQGGGFTVVDKTTRNLPGHGGFIADIHQTWNISGLQNGRYLFTIFADNDMINNFPFSIID